MIGTTHRSYSAVKVIIVLLCIGGGLAILTGLFSLVGGPLFGIGRITVAIGRRRIDRRCPIARIVKGYCKSLGRDSGKHQLVPIAPGAASHCCGL